MYLNKEIEDTWSKTYTVDIQEETDKSIVNVGEQHPSDNNDLNM